MRPGKKVIQIMEIANFAQWKISVLFDNKHKNNFKSAYFSHNQRSNRLKYEKTSFHW